MSEERSGLLPPVQLSALAGALGLALPGADDPVITGLAYDSRRVRPGYLFVAVAGFHVDGHRFLSDAIARGAAGAVVSRPEAIPPGFAALVVPDTRQALAVLATALYGSPARDLVMVGITGTDGKTTTCCLATAVLEAGGMPAGRLTTVDFRIGGEERPNPSRQSTLESLEIQEYLAAMRDQGDRAAVLEATSHGLALARLDGCVFDLAVLTNLSHEHLDFHGTPEAYREAKARLFARLAPAPRGGIAPTAILNHDDPNWSYFAQRARGRVITYGRSAEATVTATDVEFDTAGVRFSLRIPGAHAVRVGLRLPGRFNLANALAAAAIGHALELSSEQIAAGLESVEGVCGRMEAVDEGQPFRVVVDYAHTPEALANVLEDLRPLPPGRLIAVFGSAGERDTTKRALQGAVAVRAGAFAVFTNEDPRDEDENAILRQIAEGAVGAGAREGRDFLLLADRRLAIRAALERARAGDTVVLAGKGHESCIIVGGRREPWNERAVARDELRALGYRDPRLGTR